MPKKNVIKKSALTPTVLIAGGAGFVGSHLAETLLVRGSRVVVLDNFRTGKKSYLNHLLPDPKFALYDVDINQGLPPEIESVDYIFHMAGVEEHSPEVSFDSLLTNALGTKNLLELGHKSEAKFVLASSIEVYQGMMSQMNLEEYFGKTTDDIGKYSMTEAKRYAEALVWEYYKKYGSDVRIVRLPEVYGPKMDLESTGEMGRLIQELVDDGDLSVFGDGTDKEDYLFISDAVAGLVKAIFNKETKGKVYSLIGSDPYSSLEIAYLLKSIANKEIKVVFKTKNEQIRPRKTRPDTFNLRDLEWEPRVSFKDGLIKTLNWFGYEPNLHSFKPAKLIEAKRKEKGPEMLESLAGLAEPVPAPAYVPPAPVVKEEPAEKEKAPAADNLKPYKITKLSDSAVEDFIKPKKLIKNPIHFSKPKARLVVTAVLLILFGLLTFVGVPAAQFYFNFNRGIKELEKAPLMVGQFNSEAARQSSNEAFISLYKSQKAFNSFGWIFKLAGKGDLFNSTNSAISSLGYVSKSSYYFSKAFEPFSSMWEIIRPNSDKVFDPAGIETSKTEFAAAKNNLQLAEASYKNVDINQFPLNIQDEVKRYESVLTSATSNMDMISAALAGFSDLVGVDQPKKYLILFQNSNEIRPTGGFIGSYAVLEMEKGKIKNLNIDDVYNPDGQIDLREIQEPAPAPIKNLLEEPYLHIRNANWNPDFPQSAFLIEDLYSRVSGDKIDGVIAVDLYFAKNILEVTGPIFLTAYNEEISSENLYERAQYHSEFNYTNGSDQKKSFLTLLGSKLMEKVFAMQKEELPLLWSAIYQSLNEKHALVYLNSNPFGAFLEEEGWDGSLAKADNDYLYVVNANLGGTKANYFVKNDMKYEVKSLTRDGLLRGILTLKYEHTGENDSWPGGPYEDYVRVITQTGTKLTGASIKLNDLPETDIMKDIVIDKVGNYNSFESTFKINPKDILTLTFYYDIPTNLSITKDKMAYSLYWQKQPGTQEDKFNFAFEPPFGLQSNVTGFEGVLDTDKEFHVTLEPL